MGEFLEVGQRVEAYGLVGRADLNGRVGCVLRYRRRWRDMRCASGRMSRSRATRPQSRCASNGKICAWSSKPHHSFETTWESTYNSYETVF